MVDHHQKQQKEYNIYSCHRVALLVRDLPPPSVVNTACSFSPNTSSRSARCWLVSTVSIIVKTAASTETDQKTTEEMRVQALERVCETRKKRDYWVFRTDNAKKTTRKRNWRQWISSRKACNRSKDQRGRACFESKISRKWKSETRANGSKSGSLEKNNHGKTTRSKASPSSCISIAAATEKQRSDVFIRKTGKQVILIYNNI